MRNEVVRPTGETALAPAAAIKLEQQASREHQRATRRALDAIAHAVKAGQALIKARELCEYGQWNDFIAQQSLLA